MNLQKIAILILLVLLFAAPLGLESCGKMSAIDNGGAEEVNKGKPTGFISLKEAAEKAKGVMEYSFLEEYLSFVDNDGYSVGGGLVTDRSFLITYQGEYYVNEEKFLQSLSVAAISPEQRRKRYGLEDTIEMRGAGDTIYTVKINAFDSVKKDDVTTYTIEYSVVANTTMEERVPFINVIRYKEKKDYIY